jgi:hypothetical protein
MNRYHEIERKNGIGSGLLPDRFDIDDRRCQYVLKDYAWRVVEEIGETLDVWLREGTNDHVKEEIADGLHFLVELLERAGIGPKDIVIECGGDRLEFLFDEFGQDLSETGIVAFIAKLGMAMNCLKNKPWKQTQFTTDRDRFKRKLIQAFQRYITWAHACGMTADSLYDMYIRKNRVNRFRIDSKY